MNPCPTIWLRLPAEPSLKGVRLALPREYLSVEGMEPAVRSAFDAPIKQLEGLGAELGEVSLPHTQYGLATYYLIAPAECSANLARYDGVKYSASVRDPDASLWDVYERTRGTRFGAEVKRRIILGTYALSSGYYDAYYLKAQKVRTLIKHDFDEVFSELRRRRDAHQPDRRLRAGRQDPGPAGHVPERPVHDPDQPGRPAWHQHPRWTRRRPAGGTADHRQGARRARPCCA